MRNSTTIQQEIQNSAHLLIEAGGTGQRLDEEGRWLCYWCGDELFSGAVVNRLTPDCSAPWNSVYSCQGCAEQRGEEEPLRFAATVLLDEETRKDLVSRLLAGKLVSTNSLIPSAVPLEPTRRLRVNTPGGTYYV